MSKQRSKTLRLMALSLVGLKGALESDAIRLEAPVTFIHGGNTCGKSRLRSAIELLVLGYATGVPETPKGVMRLATDDDLTVRGEWTDGTDEPIVVERAWRRREILKGKKAGQLEHKVTASISTTPSTGNTANAQAIRDLFGDPAVFDLQKFLDLSDKRRRAYIFDLGGDAVRDAWSVARARAELAEVHRPLVDRWKPTDESILDWVWRVTIDHHDRALELRRRAFEQRAAERALREELEAPDPAVVGEMRTQIADDERDERQAAEARGKATATARTALDQARARARAIDDATAAARGTRAELERLRGEGEGEGEGEGVGTLRATLAALTDGSAWPVVASLADLRADVETAKAKRGDQIDQAPAQRAREAVQAAERIRDAAVERAGSLREIIAGAGSALDAAQANARTAADRVGALEAIIEGVGWGDPACPTCGQSCGAAALQAIQALADTAQEESEAKAREKAQADHALAEHEPAVTEARAAIKPLESLATEAESTIEAETKRRRNAYNAADDAVRDRLHAIDDATAAIAAATTDQPVDPRIATLEERLKGQEDTAGQDRPDVSGCEAALAQAAAKTVLAEDAFAGRMASPRAELKAAEEALVKLQEAEEAKANALELDEERETAEAIAEAFGPDGLMGKVVEEVTRPLCEAVNAAICGLQLGTFAVHLGDRRGHPVFHLGLERPRSKTVAKAAESDAKKAEAEAERLGSDLAIARAQAARRVADRTIDFHNVETISGGESAATLAGVRIGLAVVARSPWRVAMVDELQDLDIKRRRMFLRRVVEMVGDGKLDQALLFGCPDKVETIEGVASIKLDGDGWRKAKGKAAA